MYLAVLVGYLVALMLFGLWMARRVRGTDGFFVADRALGPGLLFSTFLGANIGAGSFVATAGLGYRDGISAWWWIGSAGIGGLLLAMWIGPRIWRVAKANGLYTVGDYLELRFGSTVRVTVVVLLWVVTISILSAQLIAMSQILQFMLGTPRWMGALLGGIVVTVYFSAGGLLASAWVNLVQVVVLLGGFAVALPLALSQAGGWGAVVQAAPQHSDWSSLWSGPESGWLLMVLLVPAFTVSPGLLQKAFAARDERALRIGIGLHGLVLLAFAFVPPLIGMIAHVYAPGLSGAETELATPIVLTEGLPLFLGMLGLAAVFSAEVSTADTVLFMLSTSLSEDVYKRFLAPKATAKQVLRVARVAAVGGGILGMLLAIIQPTVLGALKVFYSVLSVSLLVPIVAGLHSKRPDVPEVLAGIGTGVVVLYLAARYDVSQVARVLDPTLLGILASALAFGLVFAIRRPRVME